MVDALISYFEKHIVLNEKEKEYLKEHIPIQIIEKNHILLSEGDVSKAFFFVFKGCIRLFYTNDTEEKTAFFYTENQFVSAYESFMRQTPSKQNLQAVERSTIAVISHEVSFDLLEKFPKFESLARIMMEEELIVYQNIVSSFVTMNAEQRYTKLINSNDPILQRIPQHQLATFLGVTAETLSRIRKRIISK